MTGEKPKETSTSGTPRRASALPFSPVLGLLIDSRKQLNLKVINVVLMAAAVGLTVRFAYIIDSSYKKMQTIDFKMVTDAGGEFREKVVLKKLDYYLEKIKKRDIFRIGLGNRPENMIEAGPSSKAAEATQNLRLVGISWSDDPDAMVEDTKAFKTFFVKKGQFIGDVKVENITKDKIILRIGQELIEIR